MKKEVFSEVLGNINEIYVQEAREARETKTAGKPAAWVKWVALASCLCLVVCLYIPFARLTARFTQDKLPTDDMQIIEYNNAYYEVCDDRLALKRLGIKQNITSTDAGEFVTYLKKKIPDGKSEYVVSEEASDIILYSYTRVPCEAVYIICDNGQYDAVVFCSFVFPDNEAVSLEKVYGIYDIKSASDISSISVVDSRSNRKIVGPTLTDETVISRFYSLSLALKDYSHRDHHKMNYGHIATEEELVQAYEKTAESELAIMIETVDRLRFCLEYDAEGGWIRCSQTTRCYRVTEEMASWFSDNLLPDRE